MAEALAKPWAPSILMYIHEMGRMSDEPYGAAATPGPPPPCGMQNVLCMFRWQTSAPQVPGDVRPHCAFKLAPSMYTCPPHSWVMRVSSVMVSSKTPYVD